MSLLSLSQVSWRSVLGLGQVLCLDFVLSTVVSWESKHSKTRYVPGRVWPRLGWYRIPSQGQRDTNQPIRGASEEHWPMRGQQLLVLHITTEICIINNNNYIYERGERYPENYCHSNAIMEIIWNKIQQYENKTDKRKLKLFFFCLPDIVDFVLSWEAVI